MDWQTKQQKYRAEGFRPTPGRVNSWNERAATRYNLIFLYRWVEDIFRQREVQINFCQVIQWLKENPTIHKFRRTREPAVISPLAYFTRSPVSVGLSPGQLAQCGSLPGAFSSSSSTSSLLNFSGAAMNFIPLSGKLPSGNRRSLASVSSTSSFTAPPNNTLRSSTASTSLTSLDPLIIPTRLPFFPSFSVIQAYFLNSQRSKFIALFKLSAQSGKFGVVKIGCEIEQEQDQYILKRPIAVKVIHKHSGSTAPALGAWAALYPEHVYMTSRSSGEQALAKYGFDEEALKAAKRELEENRQLEFLDSKYYIAMPWFGGCEFFEILNLTVTQFNFLEKLKMSLALIAVLKKLHAKGWVHSDLKAENVIFEKLKDGSFVAFLVDLDDAKLLDEPVDICGTLEYLAPEVLEQLSKKQCRASFSQDIFALGVLLAELWVGSGSILGSRVEFTDRCKEDNKTSNTQITKEECYEKLIKILPDRESLYSNICYINDNDVLEEISWSERYFPGVDTLWATNICEPLKMIIYTMMSPILGSGSLTLDRRDHLPRPSLDQVEKVLNEILEKVYNLPFQPTSCSLLANLFTGFSEIRVPITVY